MASGIREDRKGLHEMLSYARKGDVILVYKTDRISRFLKNMIELIEQFNQKGISFKSISEPNFNTTSANGKFIVQLFGIFARFERNLIRERTKAGLEGARRRNQLLVRPKGFTKATMEKHELGKLLYERRRMPIGSACQQANISTATFYSG